MIGERNILCIDWDERALRIVEAIFRRAAVRIRKAVQVPIGEDVNVRDPVSMGAFLKRTLGEHRLRTRRAIIDVPRQDAMLNLMSLPSGSADEMAAMVHVQAAKELPFAKDQAVIDFAVTPGEAQGGLKEVWVAAVRTAVVDRYRQAVVNAGLRLERIGLRPYANVTALPVDDLGDGRVLLVDVGPSMTEINVIEQRHLVFSRAASVSIPVSGLAPTEPSPRMPRRSLGEDDAIPVIDDAPARMSPMEGLMIEVSRTVEAYRASVPGATIDAIVLAGQGGLDEHVVQRFQARFGAATRIYTPPAELRWEKGADVSPVPFCAAIGLALSNVAEGQLHFDFLHPKEPEAGERLRRRQRPIMVATVAAFVAAAGVLAYRPIQVRQQEVTRLKALKEFENQDQEARELLLAQVADLEAWEDANVIWIDKLAQLAEVLPSNQQAYITKLNFTRKGEIIMEVVSKDEEVASEIVEAVARITDSQGRPIFHARPGKAGASRVEGYPVEDEVEIQLAAFAEKQ